MARTLDLSIPESAQDRNYGLNRLLRRWLGKQLRQLQPLLILSAERCQAERYRKHFHSFGHACLLIYHGLSGSPSLRQSYAVFPTCHDLAMLSGLKVSSDPHDERLSVSFSQFAESNSSRPAAFLAGIIASLAGQLRKLTPSFPIPTDLHLLDSTFLRLSLKLSPWLGELKAGTVPGVKVQMQYQAGQDLPEHVLVTDHRTNDCQGFDLMILDDPKRLEALKDQTLIFDLGYYSHARFAQLRVAGIHFVTRLNTQASVKVEADMAIQPALPSISPGRIQIISDQRVTVGSAENKKGAVLPGLRLVRAVVQPSAASARSGGKPVTYQMLTDRWDLTAAEVTQCYLWRWQIELFFRWLKSHLHLPKLLGYSRNAVELTVWLAIVVHLLIALAAKATNMQHRMPTLAFRIRAVLNHFGLGEPETPPPGVQLPFPGWGPSALPPETPSFPRTA